MKKGRSRSSHDSHEDEKSLVLEPREAFGVRVYSTALSPERGCVGVEGTSRSTPD